jgi:hypothetical protein
MGQVDVRTIEAFTEQMAQVRLASERFAKWAASVKAATDRFSVLREVRRWPR